MDCTDAEKKVLPYLRNELSDEETAAFISHVGSCKKCYDELEIYFTITNALQTLDDENVTYDIGKMIEDDMQARMAAIRKRKRIRKLMHFSIIAGIVILGLLILAILYPDEMVSFVFSIPNLFSFSGGVI